MPRIPLKRSKADVAPEYAHVVDGVMDVFGAVRGPFGVLLHSPAMAELLLPMVPFVREQSVVPDLPRMLAVLAAVREECGEELWWCETRAGTGGVRSEK